MNQGGVFPPKVNLVAPSLQIDFPRSAPDSTLVTITAAALTIQLPDKCNECLAMSRQRRKLSKADTQCALFQGALSSDFLLCSPGISVELLDMARSEKNATFIRNTH